MIVIKSGQLFIPEAAHNNYADRKILLKARRLEPAEVIPLLRLPVLLEFDGIRN